MSKSVISIIKICLAVTTVVFAAQYSFDLPLGKEQMVPITLQSLAVLCWAVFLTPSESLVTIAVYIALGAGLNLPVFADGAYGMEVLTGNTGGYIIGFGVAAVVVSWVRNPYRKETILSLLLLMLIGTTIIVASGLMYLSLKIGVKESFEHGFYPIWKGAVIKIIAGTIICFIIDRILHATGNSSLNNKNL